MRLLQAKHSLLLWLAQMFASYLTRLWGKKSVWCRDFLSSWVGSSISTQVERILRRKLKKSAKYDDANRLLSTI